MQPPKRHKMALREDQLLGLYIAIPLYFVLLAGAAIWARKRMEQLVHDKVSDHLSGEKATCGR